MGELLPKAKGKDSRYSRWEGLDDPELRAGHHRKYAAQCREKARLGALSEASRSDLTQTAEMHDQEAERLETGEVRGERRLPEKPELF